MRRYFEISVFKIRKVDYVFLDAFYILKQSFGIRTAGLEEKSTACQMLVCYARELKEGFASYTEEVVGIMVPLLKFYFHDGILVHAGN